jgi:hypothetical protein
VLVREGVIKNEFVFFLVRKEMVETQNVVVSMTPEEHHLYMIWVENGRRLKIAELPVEEQRAIRCQWSKNYTEKKKAEDPDEFRRKNTERKRTYRAKLKAEKV